MMDVINEVEARVQTLLTAYNEDRFTDALNETFAIGRALFPDDPQAADRVAFAVRVTASEMYFGGIGNMLNNRREESDRRIVVKLNTSKIAQAFVPPF